MKAKILIGTPCITRPNMFGNIINETPKTITLEIIKMDFRPKSSHTITCKFDKNSREWFSDQIGRRLKFWKTTGIQIGGRSFIPNHDLIISQHEEN